MSLALSRQPSRTGGRPFRTRRRASRAPAALALFATVRKAAASECERPIRFGGRITIDPAARTRPRGDEGLPADVAAGEGARHGPRPTATSHGRVVERLRSDVA